MDDGRPDGDGLERAATPIDRRRGTRGRLLDAGLELHRGLGRELLRRSFTSQAVADAASVHRQTFYRHWDTVGDYVDELVERSLRPGQLAGGAFRPESVADVAGSADVLRAALLAVVDELADEPSQRLRLALWSVREGDEQVTGALQLLVEDVEGQVTAAVEALCAAWGREPLPPFTAGDVATLVWSLAVGVVMRADAVGRPAERELFADAVIALLPALTRRAEDDHDLTNSRSLIDRAAPVGRTGPPLHAGLGGPLRPLLLEVARHAIEQQGIAGADPAVVADQAGLTAAEVRAELGSAEQIVLLLVEDEVVPLADAVEVDLRSDVDPVQALRRHAHRLAMVALRQRNLFAAALCLAVEGDALHRATLVREAIARPAQPLVAAGVDRGLLQVPSAAVAADLVTDLLLLRVVGSADDEAAALAGDVVDLWLFGVQVPPGAAEGGR